MIEVPIWKFLLGSSLKMKGGEIIDLFKYQIRDLIKIWYLPEVFQVNSLSPQNPYVSLVQCWGQFMWIQLDNLNPLAALII